MCFFLISILSDPAQIVVASLKPVVTSWERTLKVSTVGHQSQSFWSYFAETLVQMDIDNDKF